MRTAGKQLPTKGIAIMLPRSLAIAKTASIFNAKLQRTDSDRPKTATAGELLDSRAKTPSALLLTRHLMNRLAQLRTLGIKAAGCVFCVFAIQHNAAAQSLPDSIELEYKVTLGAAELGALSSKLTKQDDYYEATAETHAEGMASILLGGTVREYCRFTVDNAVVTPEIYRIVREGQDPFDRKAGFNWDERAVQFSDGEKIVISDGYVVDNCSIPFALIAGGASTFENRILHIVGGTKVRKFKHVGISRERVNTALGEFDTVKIEQVRFEKPDRKLTFWLAPDRHNLPVKIVEQRKSRPDTTMLLKSVTGL